jgi:hypothetical protein
MKRRVALAFCFFVTTTYFLLSFLNVEAASSSIVINSYRAAGTKPTDEYVELYNRSSTSVNISGWQLARKSSSGLTKYILVTSFPNAQINPGESLVVGHADSLEPVAIPYTTANSVSEDSTIILYSDAGKTIVDKVGFGKATEFEGAAAPSAVSDVWTRSGGIDTDNNAADFKKVSLGAKDYSGICLSEIMPAPAEGEEWVEIYNSETTKDIGGLIVADKLGAVKQFKVPEGTIISEGQYLVFYKKDNGITMNDDGDGLILIDATGKVFDDTGESYGSATKGAAYAFDGKTWRWTATPTPGAANRVNASTEALLIVSKKKAVASTASASASTRGTLPTAEVLGATSQSQSGLFNSGKGNLTDRDRLFGIILIGVALGGGLVYTIYVNREKLVNVYNKERTGYSETWEKVWGRFKRR